MKKTLWRADVRTCGTYGFLTIPMEREALITHLTLVLPLRKALANKLLKCEFLSCDYLKHGCSSIRLHKDGEIEVPEEVSSGPVPKPAKVGKKGNQVLPPVLAKRGYTLSQILAMQGA